MSDIVCTSPIDRREVARRRVAATSRDREGAGGRSRGPDGLARCAHIRDVVRRQTSEARSKGATLHIDAGNFPRSADGTPWLARQVLTNVDHGMSIACIMKVGGDEETVRLMNYSAYSLSAAVWTRDRSAAAALGTRIETGTVYMNRCDYLDPALAWTGFKDTGRGVSLSRLGYASLTRPKSFHPKDV